MPVVPQLLTAALTSSATTRTRVDLAENMLLYLPSDVLRLARQDREAESPATAAERTARRDTLQRGFAEGLVEAESKLRLAQCHSGLDDLRTKLHMRTQLRNYKKINVRNQRPNLRANEALSSIERRIRRAAGKYRTAREALESLAGTFEAWDLGYAAQLRELKDEDIRSLDADDPDTVRKKKKMKKGKKVAEGSKKVSWIWRGADTNDELNPGECIVSHPWNTH